jgi:hypothetical protein
MAAKTWERGQDIPGEGETTSEQARDVIQRLSKEEWVRFVEHVSGAARFASFDVHFDENKPSSLGWSASSGTGSDRCSRLAEILQLRWFNNPRTLPGKANHRLRQGAQALRAKLGAPKKRNERAEVKRLRDEKGMSWGQIANQLKAKGYREATAESVRKLYGRTPKAGK